MPTSDIDLAVYTNNQQPIYPFVEDIEENTNTLLKFDIAFISPDSNQDFIRNIEKDSVIVMSTFQEKQAIFQKAVKNLTQAVDECNQTNNDLMRDGVIQRFEYTAELAWKTVRMYLIEEGILDAKTPKAIMKEAYAIGLISNDTEWNNLLNSRNLTSHIYDEQNANAVYNDISSKYLPLFPDLAEKLA